MKVVYSPRCLEFEVPGHPEAPDRVKLIADRLKKEPEFLFVEPRTATDPELRLVHHDRLIKAVKQNSFYDPDTPNIEGIYDYAKLAAGAAVMAAESAVREGTAFSLMRPPGHHASRTRVGGFCYFNNLAVGAARLLKQGRRVAILDLDVHHGNGTQDIFLGREGVVFCSLHQAPLYPGTGQRGEKNCHNFTLPAGTTIGEYGRALSQALMKVKDFSPDVLAVSLGFDTHREDPLAGIKLETGDYQTLGQAVSQLELPTFFVLEGGYSSSIAEAAHSFLISWL